MATGAFFAAFGYELWVATGTTASTAPTSTAGLTRIFSLDNAGIQSTSDTVDVIDYGSDGGFKANLVTGNSYTISCSMNLDVTDAGYALLKNAALTAGTGTTLRWFRLTPVTDGSSDTAEAHAGVAFVTNFSEDITAGNVAKVTFDLAGYGAYTFVPQGGTAGTGIATVTITDGGANLTAKNGVELVGGSGFGAIANLTVVTGAITAVTIVNAGTGYAVNDVLTVLDPAVVGTGDTLPTFEVATLV
jgi:hypothetical protein